MVIIQLMMTMQIKLAYSVTSPRLSSSESSSFMLRMYFLVPSTLFFAQSAISIYKLNEDLPFYSQKILLTMYIPLCSHRRTFRDLFRSFLLVDSSRYRSPKRSRVYCKIRASAFLCRISSGERRVYIKSIVCLRNSHVN